ncbi:unnamed protein product [Miscanthus lutarioriparius]|uniref:Uncharacterized protein n=1 Tax=Miscanthus lutarioriparius TaxID=422564 RepID=A0A811N7C0_9POAL|nr:unnamed protein product [Miscanthus lutarioriparius]
MAHHGPLAVAVLLLPLVVASAATDFDFFHHVQQWPGSYCNTNTNATRCFPGGEKPAADFGIHGLWPEYAACRPDAVNPNKTSCWPDSCNATAPLDLSQIRNLDSDLRRNWGTLSCKNRDNAQFWSHEWSRHGTCSNVDHHSYFLATLELKARFNLTRILLDAGVVPSDDKEYCLRTIRDAVAAATGSAPMVECNRNERNETQLYQVFQCVGLDGRTLVHCPLPEQRGAPTWSSSHRSRHLVLLICLNEAELNLLRSHFDCTVPFNVH